jgi:colanic acid biosynthesis glycosyl transferase WcaI
VLGLVGHLVRFIYKHCTLVLGQSKSFLVSISEYCSSPEKIRYFPSWAEDVYGQTNAKPATEINRLRGGFNVLFAGNIGESQDFPAVLDAAEALRAESHVRWFIVGDGRKIDWLKAEVARRGLKEHVFLLGRHPIERMPSFYACADALLVPLKRDPVFSMTIPGKVQTYLMAGVPLLGMLDGEGAKVISDAKAGLVCPAGDSLGLAKALQQMRALSPEDRNQLGINGRAFAEIEFGRGLLMDRLVGLLHEAVDMYRKKREAP